MNEPGEYRVDWAIDVDAVGVIDAAIQAREIHRDQSSIANVFTVTDPQTKRRFEVDLDNGGRMHQLPRTKMYVTMSDGVPMMLHDDVEAAKRAWKGDWSWSSGLRAWTTPGNRSTIYEMEVES